MSTVHDQIRSQFQAETEDHEHDLAPSKLGTKSYWDDLYILESTNHAADPSDEGIVWFDDSDAENRIVRYLENRGLDRNAKILDVGTGNGHLLFALIESEEFDASGMIGIDYSEQSITLAKAIAEQRGDGCENVQFEQADVVNHDLSRLGEFDVVLDKGTYDAISLAENGKMDCEAYMENIEKLVKIDKGMFLLTSCNWTEEELVAKVEKGGMLVKFDRINYKKFTFGGQEGSTICSVAFKRKRVVNDR